VLCGPSADQGDCLPRLMHRGRAGRLVLVLDQGESRWQGGKVGDMFNKMKRMLARIWRPRRRRRTDEHGFYDQNAARRYRDLHESRQDGDLPF